MALKYVEVYKVIMSQGDSESSLSHIYFAQKQSQHYANKCTSILKYHTVCDKNIFYLILFSEFVQIFLNDCKKLCDKYDF